MVCRKQSLEWLLVLFAKIFCEKNLNWRSDGNCKSDATSGTDAGSRVYL